MTAGRKISVQVGGRTVTVPSEAVALMIGIPHDELLTELRKHGGDMSKMPADWQRRANRRTREAGAAVNSMKPSAVLDRLLQDEVES